MKDKKQNLEEITKETATEVTTSESELEATVEQQSEQRERKGIEKFFIAIGHGVVTCCKTLWRWTKRMFMGASKELKELSDEEKFNVEAIESPLKQTVKSFFRKPLAVGALCVVVLMFALVFIGPLFMPLDLSYSESMHQNMAPGYNMMRVPRALAKNVKSISSFSYFSVGVDNDGKLYVWGNTKIPNSATGADLSEIPDELKKEKVAFAAAGYDHAIAITESGKVVGWGEYNNAQYGTDGILSGTSQVMDMPRELINGTIDVNQVAQLTCGYQVTAIVMKNGSVYVWGNYKSGADNMRPLGSRKDVAKISFLGSRCVALLRDGTVWLGIAKTAFELMEVKDEEGNSKFINIFDEYLVGRKVVDIATTNGSIALVTEDGELIISGILNTTGINAVAIPQLEENEDVINVEGGAKHYTILTNKHRLYSFGDNALRQCKAPTKIYEKVTNITSGGFQSYALDKDGKIISKWGCKGYLMGTDDLGRDIFNRIVNGGKQTMTIGAVAVIISAAIAIIIGCISGYFGGWVDMLLMRVTEIFSAIPFLPFALILSAILAGSSLTEDMRIFMIMVILGLLSWTGLAHMIRGQVLAEREKEFVIAAKAMGVRESRIAFKHILPNVMSVILVSLTLDFAGCMLTESSLSYLGFGVQLPRPTWGNMLNGSNNEVVIGQYWWRWLFPALFLLITTICINIIGDALRDVLDPKSSAER